MLLIIVTVNLLTSSFAMVFDIFDTLSLVDKWTQTHLQESL